MNISELPQEVKEKALEYQRNETITFHSKTTDILSHAFNWENTTEGYKYWFDWDWKEPETISPDELAIGFAEWISKEEYGLIFWEKYNTSKNLLEIFKKEKGL